MHFDIHFRSDVVNKIKAVVSNIHDWNINDTYAIDEIKELIDARLVNFEHCPTPDRPFLIAGADGSGDFPCVQYGDSVVYLVTAMSRLYEATTGPMSELPVKSEDIADFLWLPENKAKAREQYLITFSSLMGLPLKDICENSDYYEYAKTRGKQVDSPADLLNTLILPPAHDSANIGIQLYSTAEAGALIRLMRSMENSDSDKPVYILEDTTLALPMISAKSTLFFEIAKRYACEYARKHGFIYMTLSKSHNMPCMDLIEEEIKKKNSTSEHWFFRLPSPRDLKEKELEFLKERSVPPAGAISYVFKFHNTTQPMRLDMSLKYWKESIYSEDKKVEEQREKQLFRDLDYASHDQRCYGYPYPIKACHDVASLTEAERVALRKQIIDEAVEAGLKRKNFIDPSIQTGHK